MTQTGSVKTLEFFNVQNSTPTMAHSRCSSVQNDTSQRSAKGTNKLLLNTQRKQRLLLHPSHLTLLFMQPRMMGILASAVSVPLVRFVVVVPLE